MRRPLLALMAAATLAGAPTAALAADCPRTSLGDVEDEVMCPVCGVPLELATEAPQAQRERQFIQRLIDRCASKGEVKRALVAQFGQEVLALPGDEEKDDLGDVLAYAIPALAVLLGAAGIAVAVRRWRRRRLPDALEGEDEEGGDPGGVPEQRRPTAPSGAAAARLDSDLDRYDL